MLNLDTHIVLHALTGDLTRRERALLTGDSWSISAIVIWEIGKLAELDRIEIDLDDPELGRTLHRIHVWPLSLDICRAIRTLDVRSDPADEIIAATSMVHRAPLVTRERRLLSSRRVPLAR